MKRLIVTIALLASMVSARGQELPIVRIEAIPDTVLVGEAIELKVTVIVPTWFTRPTVYPSFELSGAITRLPADSSFSYRERVGSESWSAIERSYQIFPLLGATYRLDGQSLSITYANPGSDALTANIDMPAVSFRATVPAGAETLNPYIAGSRLELSLEVDSDLDTLKIGDAIVLTYSAELDGLPAIFLPPLAPELTFEGASVYSDAATLVDGAVASRTEKITLVFDGGGNYNIPEFQLGFWNTQTNAIEQVKAGGFSIVVSGPAVAVAPPLAAEQQWKRLAAVLVAIGLAIFAIYRQGPVLFGRIRARTERRRKSESHAFAAVQSALRSKNTHSVYCALLVWLERLGPGLGIQQLQENYGDESLSTNLNTLREINFGNEKTQLNFRRLRSDLVAARTRYLRQFGTISDGALPPLNP